MATHADVQAFVAASIADFAIAFAQVEVVANGLPIIRESESAELFGACSVIHIALLPLATRVPTLTFAFRATLLLARRTRAT